MKEKELTRARDALAAERRRMPRMLVDRDYAFDGPGGRVGLLDLFDGRPQRLPLLLRPGHVEFPRARLHGLLFLADQVQEEWEDSPAG